jgi:hypothetical protein
MNFTNKIVAWVAVVLALAAIGLAALPNGAPRLSGTTNYDSLSLSETLSVTGATTLTGAAALNGGLTIGSGGTAMTSRICATKAFDPGSFSSTTSATTTIGLAGAVTGDLITATLATTTSGDQWYIPPANITAAGATASATIQVSPLPGTAAWNAGLNLGSATLTACYTH